MFVLVYLWFKLLHCEDYLEAKQHSHGSKTQIQPRTLFKVWLTDCQGSSYDYSRHSGKSKFEIM